MKRLATAGACCCLLLAACTPSGGSTPSWWETSTGSPTRSVTPIASPSPPATASPSPTQDLSEDQQAALDVVKEYLHLINIARKDSEADLIPIVSLFSNQEVVARDTSLIINNRKIGAYQTGDPVYHYRPIGEPTDAGGVRSVEVIVCSDSSEVDVVDPNGTSVLNQERTGYAELHFDVVQQGSVWLINDRVIWRVEGC